MQKPSNKTPPPMRSLKIPTANLQIQEQLQEALSTRNELPNAFRNTLIKQGSNDGPPFGQYNTFMKQATQYIDEEHNSTVDSNSQLKGAVSLPSSQNMMNFATLKQLSEP